MASIVRITAPLGSVIVLVLDVVDVWLEGSKAVGMIMELELEDL